MIQYYLWLKCTENIDKMWARLKRASDDPKIVIRKMSRNKNLNLLWRLKSLSKVAKGLTKAICTIKDLMQLMNSHKQQATR